MKILAIGAHPDDVEYGCAGALIHHAQRGDEVYIMIVTDGAQGGDPETRRQEQLAAAKVVGARDVFFGGYPDTKFECHQESITAIESVIGQVNPDSV